MKFLIVFLLLMLGVQVGIFFMIRAKRKKEKASNVIDKYNIRSASDAFRLIQDQTIPEEDRDKIERLYTAKG